jgi:hypothetical protein
MKIRLGNWRLAVFPKQPFADRHEHIPGVRHANTGRQF